MSVNTTCRQISFAEAIAEMDRRGDVIEKLEAEIEQLKARLARTVFEPSWENPDGPGAA